VPLGASPRGPSLPVGPSLPGAPCGLCLCVCAAHTLIAVNAARKSALRKSAGIFLLFLFPFIGFLVRAFILFYFIFEEGRSASVLLTFPHEGQARALLGTLRAAALGPFWLFSLRRNPTMAADARALSLRGFFFENRSRLRRAGALSPDTILFTLYFFF
jgi:hypothetical protein